MSIGKKLKLIRKTLQLKQSELAQELGCSQALISLLENDDRDPIYAMLVKINKLAKRAKVKVNLL